MAEKSLSKIAIWQLLGKFALQGVAFFTVPIVTRLLSTSEYGFSSLFNTWTSIVSLFIGLNTHGSIGNARITYEKKEFNQYVSSVYTISVFSFLFFLLLLLIFQKPVTKFIGFDMNISVCLLVYSFSTYTVSFWITRLDQLRKPHISAAISFSMSALSLIIAVIFILIFKEHRAEAKIYGQTLMHIIYGLIIGIIIYAKGKSFINTRYLKFCLPLTLPLVFHTLGQLVFTQSDHIMLQKMTNDSFLGIYSIVCTMCSILLMIYGALNITWLPFYYDYKKEKREDKILLHSRRYIKLYTVISCGFLCMAPEVFKLLAPQEYWSGLKILPLFAIAYFFSFIYLFPVNFEFYHKKTFIIPLATCMAAVINIILNFFYIKRHGIMGAAVATMISYVFYFTTHFIVAKFFIRKKFEYKLIQFLPYLIPILGFIGIYYLCLNSFVLIRWILAIILTVYQITIFIKNKSIF
ncbi:MAG: lipopolysaccharide biosynthesis protein [Peptoanaerobacter stomatis]|uniref:lipopolysaccharide biosynthesis protein n=1 Tax=Peptoanaerobacter stomatis TaxID=796937 RepID=UPI003FA13449